MSQRHSYGDDPSQFGVLYGEGPVAVLLHGGFWKAEYDLTLMDALCEDLAQRGWAAWNVEYRRLGNGGGVPETLEDVSAAIDFLAELRRRPIRVVTIGHSAGGHLAAWAATRENPRVAVTGVVSQAGVLDLRRARRAEPLQRGRQPLPAGAPDADRLPDRAPPARRSRPAHPRRARRHRAGRDQRDVRSRLGRDLIVEPDEDHFGHLDPDNPLWQAVVAWL